MTMTAGIGFKTMHLGEALAADAAGLWYEVHAENYMVDGGSRLARPDPFFLHHDKEFDDGDHP